MSDDPSKKEVWQDSKFSQKDEDAEVEDLQQSTIKSDIGSELVCQHPEIKSDTRVSKMLLILQHAKIKETMECQYGLLDRLMVFLSVENVADIKRDNLNNCQRNEKLLACITASNLEAFIKALGDTNQEHLANYITQNGENFKDSEDWPLDDSHTTIIKDIYPTLVDEMAMDELLNKLLHKGCISQQQMAGIRGQNRIEFDSNRELLDHMMRRSIGHFRLFIEFIRKDHSHLLQKIPPLKGAIEKDRDFISSIEATFRQNDLIGEKKLFNGYEEKGSCTEYKTHKEILEEIERIRTQANFSLRIPSSVIKPNRVLVRYVIKTDENTEKNKQTSTDAAQKEDRSLPHSIPVFTEADVARDVKKIRGALSRIVPFAEIKMIKLKKMPRFRATAGLSSRLTHESDLGLRINCGCITALLQDSAVGDPNPKYYALTVAHLPDCQVDGYCHKRFQVGDAVNISEDAVVSQIGHVSEVIYDNGDNMEFVDAALIELKDGVIEKLRLPQSFNINGRPHRLGPSDNKRPEEDRVVLRAVDQTDDDDTVQGYISCTNLAISDDPDYPDMFNLVQLLKYTTEGKVHSGAMHGEGESGLLATYKPSSTDTPGIVKPVVMLIGVYPNIDEENGDELYETSIGIDISRVMDRLSRRIGKKLQFAQ